MRVGTLLLAIALGVAATCAPTRVAFARAEPSSFAGFEPSLHVGLGGFAGELALESGPVEESLGRAGWAAGRRRPSVGAHLVLAYRFGALLAAGLHVYHQWLDVGGLPNGTDGTATSPGAGLLVRVHPLAALWPRLPIDLSVGVGFDFIVYARQATEDGSDPDSIEVRNTATGVAMPVLLGLDVVVGDIAFGVMGMWSPWWRLEECRAEGTGDPSCERETSGFEQYLFIGAGARLHLEFVR